MQCLLPSGLSSDPNDTADLDPTTASSEPGDPEPTEPWKERVKRRAGPQLGEQKWWDFSTQKNGHPKNVSGHSPTNPLLYPAIGFFATPTGGCYGEILLPPKKMAGRGSYFFEDLEIPTPPETIRWENPPGSVGAMRIFGLEVDGDWCMMPLVSL